MLLFNIIQIYNYGPIIKRTAIDIHNTVIQYMKYIRGIPEQLEEDKSGVVDVTRGKIRLREDGKKRGRLLLEREHKTIDEQKSQ